MIFLSCLLKNLIECALMLTLYQSIYACTVLTIIYDKNNTTISICYILICFTQYKIHVFRPSVGIIRTYNHSQNNNLIKAPLENTLY